MQNSERTIPWKYLCGNRIEKLLFITPFREKRGYAKRFRMRRVKAALTPRNSTAGKRREICICRLVSRFYGKHPSNLYPSLSLSTRFLIGVVHRYANSYAISSSIGCNRQPSRHPHATSREFSKPLSIFSRSRKILRDALVTSEKRLKGNLSQKDVELTTMRIIIKREYNICSFQILHRRSDYLLIFDLL